MRTFNEVRNSYIQGLEKQANKTTKEILLLHNIFTSAENYKDLLIKKALFANDIDTEMEKLESYDFAIKGLNKLDLVLTSEQTRYDKKGNLTDIITAPKNTQFVYNGDYKKIRWYKHISDDEIKGQIETLNKTEKTHWTETEKIKDEYMNDLVTHLMNKNYEEFYYHLNKILNNARQTEKYTKAIFGKSIKHKTKEEKEKNT